MPARIWTITGREDAPIVATAIHNGHMVRSEVAHALALSDTERLYEEDPYTGRFTGVAPLQVVGLHSRFEVDLNRPRDRAVYRNPEDAWGLNVWTLPPSDEIVADSLAAYDAFYEEMEALLRRLEARFGRFIVLDLHSYNHRREGPRGPHADPEENPEVNIGTGSMDRERWAPVVDRFLSDFQRFNFIGRQLDVRENVKFTGGHFSQWVHERFPETGCALAVAFKKIFMDEWTGRPYPVMMDALQRALRHAIPGLLSALGEVQLELVEV